MQTVQFHLVLYILLICVSSAVLIGVILTTAS